VKAISRQLLLSPDIRSSDRYANPAEKQAEPDDCESQRPPWARTMWQDRPVQLPEAQSSSQRPKRWLELLSLRQSFVHLKLQFPVLVIRKKNENNTARCQNASDDEFDSFHVSCVKAISRQLHQQRGIVADSPLPIYLVRKNVSGL
jgi:hypothetical protein